MCSDLFILLFLWYVFSPVVIVATMVVLDVLFYLNFFLFSFVCLKTTVILDILLYYLNVFLLSFVCLVVGIFSGICN